MQGRRRPRPERARRRRRPGRSRRAACRSSAGCPATSAVAARDLVAGVAVTALIVPKNLGYAGSPASRCRTASTRRLPARSSTRSSARRGTSPPAELLARRGRGRRGAGRPASGRRGGAARGRDRPGHRRALPAAGGAAARLDLALPSRAVVAGFLAGAAVDVVIGELPKLTGHLRRRRQRLAGARLVAQSLGDTHGPTLLVGLVSLAVILGLRLGALGSRARSSSSWAGSRHQASSTLARTGSRSWAMSRAGFRCRRSRRGTSSAITLRRSALSAVALLLIGFSQTAGDARAFATRHRYRVDLDQESVAQGMANLGAGCSRACPSRPAFRRARSTSPPARGRRSRRSSPAASCSLTLLLLAPLFSDLPKPVLAAVIIDAVVFGHDRPRELRRLFRVARVDFWIAVAAIVGVLSVGVLAAS